MIRLAALTLAICLSAQLASAQMMGGYFSSSATAGAPTAQSSAAQPYGMMTINPMAQLFGTQSAATATTMTGPTAQQNLQSLMAAMGLSAY